ncbi:hypothetical protein ACS0TY_034045 [Phlomoides rotata]
MASFKLDVEKFNGKNDFALWRIKMKALLTQHGLGDVLVPIDPSASASYQATHKEKQEKAHSTVILCLDNKVLKEVSTEKMAVDVWKKLDSLYLAKFVSN